MCGGHNARRERYGDPVGGPRETNPTASILHRPKKPVPEQPSYAAAHQRLKKVRGRAADHQCVDCDEPAKHWSYSNNAPDQIVGIHQGYRVVYSLDPKQYAPRCARCHKRFDMEAAP